APQRNAGAPGGMRRHVRRRRRAYAGGAGLTAALLAGAGGGHVAGHHPGQAIVTPSPESTPVVSDTNIPGSGCDASFERFTYKPQRLVRIQDCVTITGVVVKIKAEADGDAHVQFKLDPQFHVM